MNVCLSVCLIRELEGKLTSVEGERKETEVRARGLAEKNSRICTELEEIGELVKQMEAEKEAGEERLRSNVNDVQVCVPAKISFKSLTADDYYFRKRMQD